MAKFAVAAVILGLGFMLWKKHQENTETAALSAVTDTNGFVALAQPDGADPKKIWIVAAKNCPKEGAQRADYLAQQLDERNMAYDRRSNVSFSLTEEDRDVYARIQKIMNAETPVIFVNGKMKANPSLTEVTAEYEEAQL